MFTAQEIEYLKSLIAVYNEQGYIYYIAHTVTESDNVYDFVIYFSKDEILATNDNLFVMQNALKISVDSSSRNYNSYNPSVHSRESVQEFSGVLNVNVAEFIYTNAKNDSVLATTYINPDISVEYGLLNSTYTATGALLVVLVITFLYIFIKDIIRLRR